MCEKVYFAEAQWKRSFAVTDTFNSCWGEPSPSLFLKNDRKVETKVALNIK